MFNRYAVDDSLFNSGLARLAGTATGVVTATGRFDNPLSGSCTGTVLTSATLSQQTKLTATALGLVATTGDLRVFPYYRPYALDGKALNVWAFNFPNEVNTAASATCLVAASGTLKLVMPLAGTSTVTALGSASISGTNSLLGTATVTATVSASLQDQVRLASSITGAATVSAALQKSLALRGTANGLVTVAADLKRDVQPGAVSSGYTPLVTSVLVVTTAPTMTASANQVGVATTDTRIYANATF